MPLPLIFLNNIFLPTSMKIADLKRILLKEADLKRILLKEIVSNFYKEKNTEMASADETASKVQAAIDSEFPSDKKVVAILNAISYGLTLTKEKLKRTGQVVDWAVETRYVNQMTGVLNSLSALGLAVNFASDIAALKCAISQGNRSELNRVSNSICAGLAIGGVFALAGIAASGAVISTLTVAALFSSGYSVGQILYSAYRSWDEISRLAYGVLDRVGAGIKGLFPATHPGRHDPLVLDLNGDGVKLTSLDGSKVNFDFGGDGFAEKTGWVSAQDGLLTLDKNNNGKIDNGSELFGSAREDGFTALSHYDLNQDGKINSSDAVFAKLRVWRDSNGNGVTDKGELLTLAQAGVQVGIKEISLEKKASGVDNAGNRIDFTGSFTRTNGKSGDSVAVSFSINQTLTKWTPPAGFKVSAEAEKLPVDFAIAA